MDRSYFLRRRKARLEKLSTAAPANTRAPSITDGGNGLLLADKGDWDNYPTSITVEWKVAGVTREFGGSYFMRPGDNFVDVSITVTAINDDGSTAITVP